MHHTHCAKELWISVSCWIRSSNISTRHSTVATAWDARLLTQVHVQTPINRLPPGSAIFFEFKHWKAKEKKV